MSETCSQVVIVPPKKEKETAHKNIYTPFIILLRIQKLKMVRGTWNFVH